MIHPNALQIFQILPSIQLKRFLHYADNALRVILQAYPLPVLRTETYNVLGYFVSISRK